MLTEQEIYKGDKLIHETDALRDTTYGIYPVFYTVKNDKILASSSALELIKTLGGFEPNYNQHWEADNWSSHPDSHDKRVLRLKPFQTVRISQKDNSPHYEQEHPTYEINDIDEFLNLQAKYIQDWIYEIEDLYPDHKQVFLAAGKDSQMAFLAKHRNDKNWIAFSGAPNDTLVEKFFRENNLDFELIKDNGEDTEDDTFIKRKIIAMDGLVNPWHFRWLQHLEKLKEKYNGKVIFWQGTLGDVFNSPTYWQRGLKTNEEFYDYMSKRGARWQGAYHQAVRNLLGVPCFSLYHSQNLWREVFMKYDPGIVKDKDIRNLLGTKLAGKDIIWQETNPNPQPYVNQKLEYDQVRGIYLKEIAGVVTEDKVISSETSKEIKVTASDVQDNFLNISLTPDNIDIYYVRSSIKKAIDFNLIFFKGTLLDLGCGEMPYKEYITNNSNISKYVGIDIRNPLYQRHSKPDLFWDGNTIPLSDNSIHTVMATELFEHLPNLKFVLKEINRVLIPGGTLFFTVPFLWPLHDVPNDEYRYTPFSLKRHFDEDNFSDVSIHALGGWNASLAQMIGLWLKRSELPEEERKGYATELLTFYQYLLQTDVIPQKFQSQVMVPGFYGTALKKENLLNAKTTQDKTVQAQKRNKNKIVVLQGGFPSVTATFILDQITGLIDRGFEIENWATYNTNTNVIHESIKKYDLLNKTKYISAPHEELKADPQKWLQTFLQINQIKDLNDIDAFHVHYGANFNLFEPLFRLSNKFVLVSFHGYDASRYFMQSGDDCYNYLFDRANLITTPSHFMKNELVKRGCPSEKIVIHRYGIDLLKFSSPGREYNKNKIVLLTVGRFVEKKGIEYSLKAFAKICRQLNTEYRIIGEGELLNKYREIVTKCGINDYVKILGSKTKTEVIEEMQKADIFVLTSVTSEDGDSEGVPVALTEAHSMGLPVISTFHSGIPELVINNETGLLSPEKDIDDIASNMLKLAKDNNLRKIFSSNAVKRVKDEFDISMLNNKLAYYFANRDTGSSTMLMEALKSKNWDYKCNLYKNVFEEVEELNQITNPSISIIVISWRLHPDNIKSFQILEKQRNQNFELIFINNGAGKNEFDELKPFVDTYVKLNKNTGAYLARNIGSLFAKAPVLLFLEDDGIPEPDLVKAHLDLFEEYDIIACRGVYIPKTDNPLNKQQGHYYVSDCEYPTFAHVEGNTSYLAETFFKAGGWDDEITFGGGGLELYFRLLKVEPDKRKQIYSPRPVIYHDYVKDEQHLKNKLEKQKKSVKRLREKYPEWDTVHDNYKKDCTRSDLLIKRKKHKTEAGIKKILFVNHNLPPYEYSGTPLTTLNHAVGLSNLGFHTAVLIPSPDLNSGYKKEILPQYTLYKIPRLDKYNAFFELYDQNTLKDYESSIKSIMDDFQPDVVQINDYVYLPAEVISMFKTPRTIVTRNVCNDEEICHFDSPVIPDDQDALYCSGPDSVGKCIDCLLTKKLNTNAEKFGNDNTNMLREGLKKRNDLIKHLYKNVIDGVIFTESSFKDHFTEFVDTGKNKIKIIPRGFVFDNRGARISKKSDGQAITFGFVGYLVFYKGMGVLLKAFEQLAETNNFKLLIYGPVLDQFYLTEIKKLQSQFPGKISYEGAYKKEDIPQIASKIDISIIPSYFDSYNRVLRELMLHGVPSIVSDFFGASIIKHGQNGLKFKIGDYNELAHLMSEVIKNPGMISQLSKEVLNTKVPSLDEELNQMIDFYSYLYNPQHKIVMNKVSQPSGNNLTDSKDITKLIAFYLPQYHPIPENDNWWGKGFTEWTNVSQARPLFDGHYQPHIPADLGFYDLRMAETRQAQADLAKKYGIYGFCYYHYWFNGKLLLEKPLHDMLNSGKPDFPFCLCWANEDWTRAWDGRSGEKLIAQNYSTEDDIKHIRYLAEIFKDRRYIRINGKPLFLVYRANQIPDPLTTVNTWREEAKKLGIGEIYLCRVESFNDEHTDPMAIGFDASIEFQPDWLTLGDPDYMIQGHSVYDYNNVVQKMINKFKPSYKRFLCVTPSWDNSPRRKDNATIFINSTPQLYENWLRNAIKKLKPGNAEEKIIFINAWNEWGEGNHLEPDQKNSTAYLEATKNALQLVENSIGEKDIIENINVPGLNQSPIKCSIIIPVFNQWEYTDKCLQSIFENTSGLNFEIIIINNASTDSTIAELARYKNYVRVINNEENIGYTLACNQGAKISKGEFIVLLNNDTTPLRNWLNELVKLAESDSSIGAVGAKLIYPDGSLQEAGGVIFSDGSCYNFGRGDKPGRKNYNKIAEVDYCTGACVLVRRDLFQKFKMFDERYAPAYSEDSDLCFTLRRNGYKVMYNPESVVVHFESMTAGKDYNSGFKRYLEINRHKFVEKWKEDLLLQDNLSFESRRLPSTADRSRLLNSSNENKFLYRKKYVFNGLQNDDESILTYFPSFNFLDDYNPSVNLFYNSDFLLALVKSYGVPWLYGRAYIEGRFLYIYQKEFAAKLSEELLDDLNNLKNNIDSLKKQQPLLIENILNFEKKIEPFLSNYYISFGEKRFTGTNALKECYKVAARFAILQGILDEGAGLPEEEGIKVIEKLVAEHYSDNKELSKFVENDQPLVSKFYYNLQESQRQKEKTKVLCFYPHNPYPPRTGADQGFMKMFNALKELGCEVDLFSSTYFVDKPWHTGDVQKFCNEKKLNVFIHNANEEDQVYITMMELRGDTKKWDVRIPPYLRQAFVEVCKETLPDIIIINYAWWGRIIDGITLPGTVTVLQMHDMLSLNKKMLAAATELMGREPYEPGNFNPLAMTENVFANLNLKADDEEYEIYNKYDYVIGYSEKECENINLNAPGTKTVLVPVTYVTDKQNGNNSYSDYPVLAISNNVFNIQAYYYFVSRVLPLIKKEIPGFKLNVIGDGCKVLQESKDVNLLGFIDDLEKFYEKSCFAIAPMIGGTGQSVKVLEAMANGLPVISLKNPYQESSIINEVNGYVAASANEFAEYAIRLYNDRALCRELGENARETMIKNYSYEKLIDNIKPVIEFADKKKLEDYNKEKTFELVKSDNDKNKVLDTYSAEDVIGSFIEKRDGKFVFVSESIYDNAIGDFSLDVIESFINKLPGFYAHFGGAGDACLFLSTFYDDEPGQVVLSFANSKDMMKSFFEPFTNLKKVYLFNSPRYYEIHQALRFILHRNSSCRGTGTTPLYNYVIEWNENLNIFEKYRVNKNPGWIEQFKTKKLEDIQIVLHPKGSAKGMVGSKRNLLSRMQWDEIISFFTKNRIKPVVIGTPEENDDYPVNEMCIDKRSYNFREQMSIIASGDLFIGADSWAKTFSALCKIPTIVFPSLRGEDLNGWKDSSDYVFIDPWEDIYLVNDNFESTFEKVKNERFKDHPLYNLFSIEESGIVWEGPQFVNHSLALVNRELCTLAAKDGFNLSLLKTEKDCFTPDAKSNSYILNDKENVKLDKVKIHVRHHFPPNLTPPPGGRWVIIQPWEYGSLPKDWTKVFSETVDEMWVPSDYVKQVYINSGVPAGKVFVVPNGYDPGKFNPEVKPYKLQTKKKFKFLFVGGTIFRKGIDVLLRAYLETFKSLDDVTLIIKDMGGNSFYQGQTFKEKILELQKTPGLPEIIYLDKMLSEKELAGLYIACNVLVHPYRGEGFGLPVLEAMGSGIPAIVTREGATADFCNETNSLLINAGKKFFDQKKIDDLETVDYPWVYEPSVEDLKEKLLYAFNNPAAMKVLGKKAYEFVSANFTWKDSFRILKERIRELSAKPVLRKKDVPVNTEDFHPDLLEAERLINENRFKEARNILNNILVGNPEEVNVLNDLSVIEILEGNLQAGLEYINKVLDLNPKDETAISNLNYVESKVAELST